MRRSHLILVIAVGIEITVCASLVTFSVLAASKQSPDALRTAVYVPRMREPYRSEDQWIAGETVRAIMEMAAYARRQPITRADLDLLEVRQAANRAEAAVIMLRFSSRSFEIPLQPYAWAPEAYEHVAFTMLGSVTTPSRQDDLLLIGALRDLQRDVLLAQNERLSNVLAADFWNPSHHESAALLLSAFALREASGTFLDLRRTLCRLTAHLALADALRGAHDRTLQGRLAEAALLSLVGRQQDAVARLNAATSAELPEEARAWLRALRLRATLDWRLLDSVKSPSLLERLERVLAQSRTTRKYDADRSRESGRGPDAEDVPDWGWRRLHLGFSVEEGSALAERTWFATYLEALIVLRGEAYPEPRPDLVKALLRQPSISCLVRTRHGAEVQVIDRGTWSAFYQRELAYTSMQATYYFAHMRRAKYEARNFRALVDRALGGLPLYEVTRRLTAQSDSEYRNSMVNLSQLVRRDPSLVSYRSWAITARRPPAGLQRPEVMPLETSWFPERFPAGTGYDIDRLDVPTDDFPILRLIDELRWMSPWSPTVVSHWIAGHCRPACSDSELRGAYYPLAEYHPTFAIQLAYARGDRTSEPLQRACNLDGEYCWYLGDWLLSHNRVREAAVVFEQYAQRVRDRAGAARLQWLARYYAEQRRTADAFWIAELAAATPSADGVRALATVLYQTGRYDEAELLYRHLRTRYGSDTDLLAYFIREARRRSEPTGARSSEFERLMRRHFPSGLHEHKLSEFSSKPDVGLSVHRPGWRQSTVGLHDGDVIVAVDNVRVSTLDQWRVLYETSFQRDLQVIVWRNGSYRSVVAPFWCYGYALDLRPYRP